MKPLLLDIDTQNDFVLPAGALYAPGAERVIPVIAELNRFAMRRGYSLLSTACLHTENDPEFRNWPPHCVAGTVGQRKPAVTLAGQPLFEKQHTDAFLDRRFAPLLKSLDASEYVVYGVVTEVCVRFAAEGVLGYGKPVTVIRDAVHPLSHAEGERFLARFVSLGGAVMTAGEFQSR